jgi:hypothetical protein
MSWYAMLVPGKTSGCRGRSFFSGDQRLGPAPCGDFKVDFWRGICAG